MGLDNNEDGNGSLEIKKIGGVEEEKGDESVGLSIKMSETSICAAEDDEDEEGRKIELGPQCTLKAQLEKDKVSISFSFSFFGFEQTFGLCLVLIMLHL